MKDRTELMGDVLKAAVRWWKGKCPIRFTEKEHLANPTINTVTEGERKLAAAVAEWVKESKRK